MWIFLNDGFFSIIEDRKNDTQLVVRARVKGDIERVFEVESKQIVVLPHRDYMYRTNMPKSKVARILTDRILEINYHNFKDSIPSHDKDRKQAYSGVWAVMYNWQDKLHDLRERWFESYYKYPVNGTKNGRGYLDDEGDDDHQRLYPR